MLVPVLGHPQAEPAMSVEGTLNPLQVRGPVLIPLLGQWAKSSA